MKITVVDFDSATRSKCCAQLQRLRSAGRAELKEPYSNALLYLGPKPVLVEDLCGMLSHLTSSKLQKFTYRKCNDRIGIFIMHVLLILK